MPDDDPYNRAGKPSQDAVAYVKEQIAQPIRPHRFELIPDHRYHLLSRAGEAANKPVRMGTHMFSGLGVLRGREPRARVPMEVLGIEAAGAKRRSSSTRSRRKRYRSLSMPSSLPVQCVKLSWSSPLRREFFATDMRSRKRPRSPILELAERGARTEL